MKLIDKFAGLTTSQKLWVLFVFALSLRFISYITHPFIHEDSVLYLSINHYDSQDRLQEGLDMHRQLPPAVLYFMRIFTVLGINAEIGYRVMSVLFYSAVIFPLFHLARNFISERAALFAVFCYAVHPEIVQYSHSILRESLSYPFIVYGLSLLILCFERKKIGYALLASVCIAISYMARLEYGVSFFGAFAVFLFLVLIRQIKIEEKKRFFIVFTTFFSTMVLLLSIVYVDMKKHDTFWDPFAYRKVKGFFLRTFK